MTTTARGFFNGLGGWVGVSRPGSGDEAQERENEAQQHAASLAAAAERMHPWQERQDAAFEPILAAVSPDLIDQARAAKAELNRVTAAFREAQQELAHLRANEPTDVDDVSEWAARQRDLELSLPVYERLSTRANEAYTQALEAVRSAMKATWAPMDAEAGRVLMERREEIRLLSEEIERDYILISGLQSRIGSWQP